MEKKTVIGTSTDMTWAQLGAIEDLNVVAEFFTDRQKACLILAQGSASLMQLLITDGYTNELTDAEGFKFTQFAEWLDNHFSKTDDDTLMKCAYIQAMRDQGINPFETDED